MNRFAPLLCLLLSGCLLNGGSTPSPVPTPGPVAPISASGVFTALADRITAGKISDSDELVGILAKLRDAGDLTAADVSRFDSAFPGLPTKNRALTADDAAKLKGL